MRLLDTGTYELKDFPSKPESYAILSHRWDANELTFADLKDLPRAKTKPGWTKIEEACRVTREDYNLELLWLDMCCIDKESSVELSEAINSMFAWYRDATICLAYLNDVRCIQIEDPKSNGSSFRNSVWFQRGWTLQELIAPNALMVFLSRDWNLIGTRPELAETISEITNIDVELLSRPAPPEGQREDRLDFSKWSIATRMSWAANRTTTRPEDCAYSLAGLFDVSMAIIYGEGGEKAFWRLQLEIIQQSTDQSIFAWGSQVELRYMPHTPSWGPTSPLGGYNFDAYRSPRNLLASHPSDFYDCAGIWPIPADYLTSYLGTPPLEERHFQRTNNGIRFQLPLLPTRTPGVFVAALVCHDVASGYWQALVLRQVDGEHTYVCIGCFDPTSEEEQPRIIDVTARDVPPDRVLSASQLPWKASTIYIQWQPIVRSPTVTIPRSLRRVGLSRKQHERWPHCNSDSEAQWLSRADDAMITSIDEVRHGSPPVRLNLSGTLEAVSDALTPCTSISSRTMLRNIHHVFEESCKIAVATDGSAYHESIAVLRLAQAELVLVGIHLCCRAWPLDVNSRRGTGGIAMNSAIEIMIKIESHVLKLGGLFKTCAEATRQGIDLDSDRLLVDHTRTLRRDLQHIIRGVCYSLDPFERWSGLNWLISYTRKLRARSSRIHVEPKLDKVMVSASCLTNTVGHRQELTLNRLPHAEFQRSRWMQIRAVNQHVERDLKRFLFSVYLPQAKYSEHTNSLRSKEPSDVRPCESIKNPDIRKLWEKMRWGTVVDTNTFVLRLYAYFIEREHEARVQARSTSIADTTRECDHGELEECMTPETVAAEAWCLDYFRYNTVATLMEVLDYNLNGLIDADKVNRFTGAQPAGITLMQWVVYNAYGRSVSAYLYRMRIERTVQGFLAGIDYFRPASSVYRSLDHSIPRVTAFLQNLREPDLGEDTEELLELVHKIMARQDREIQECLTEPLYRGTPLSYSRQMDFQDTLLGYDVESTFIHIEERVLPAVALLMQHCDSVLSQGRLYAWNSTAADSVTMIVDEVWDRMKKQMETLRGCFLNTGYDIGRAMEFLANGMFKGIHLYHTMDHLVAEKKMLKEWCLPWNPDRPAQWLAKYDPDFSSDITSLEKPLAYLSGLIVTQIGYSLRSFMSCRVRYGITLVDPSASVQAMECVNESTEGAMVVDSSEDGNDSFHYFRTCRLCGVYLVGLRFICIDCGCDMYSDSRPYCLACYNGVAGICPRGIKHCLLRQQRGFVNLMQLTTLCSYLRGIQEDRDTQPALRVIQEDEDTQPALDPLYGYCLSASEDTNELSQLEDAIFAYWKHCVAFDGNDMGVGPLEALDTVLSAIPSQVREYVVSQLHNGCARAPAQDTVDEPEDRYAAAFFCCTRKGQGCEEQHNFYEECYQCADCPDVNYCSRCFVAHHFEHEGGSHRFLLFRRPNSMIIIERVLFATGGNHTRKAGTLDPWRLDDPAASEDEKNSQMQRICGLCRHPRVSGEDMYRCLSCKLFRERDLLLCRECAFKDPAQDEHHPSHILAVLPAKTPLPVHQLETISQPNASVGIAEVVAEAPSSKMEEELAVLRTMVEKLQLTRAPPPLDDGTQHSNTGNILPESTSTTDAYSARIAKPEEGMALLRAMAETMDPQLPSPSLSPPLPDTSETHNEVLLTRLAKVEDDIAFLRAMAEKSQAHTSTLPGDQSRTPSAAPDAPDTPPVAVAKTVEGEAEVARRSRGWRGYKDKLLRLLGRHPGRRDGK